MNRKQSAAPHWEHQGGTADAALHEPTSNTIISQKGEPVHNRADKVVGRIGDDGWLVKTGLDPRLHMLRKPKGWATDAAHLKLRIVGVRIYATDGRIWEAPLGVWHRYGVSLHRGHGPQVCLPEARWRVSPKGEPLAEQLELDFETGR